MYKHASRFLHSLQGFDFGRPAKLPKGARKKVKIPVDGGLARPIVRRSWYPLILKNWQTAKPMFSGAKDEPASWLKAEIETLGVKTWLINFARVRSAASNAKEETEA